MLRHFVLFVVLFGFWILLSGQVDVTDGHQRYLLICGLASAAIGTWLAARIGFLYDEGNVARIVTRHPPYLLWLLWEVFLSNIDVALRVWSPRPEKNIHPRFMRVKYETESDLATVIYANSITLTPGTATVLVDTEKKEVLVHALTKKSARGLKAMHDKVKALEDNG